MSVVNDIKGRVAEALVESIFRKARYTVSRLGRESQVQRLVKVGADEFLPDFLLWKQVAESNEPHLGRLFAVEVKYRADLATHLRKYAAELCTNEKAAWPDLYIVFVTDLPEEGRSCFQALYMRDYTLGPEIVTDDLHQFEALRIDPAIVEEHEEFARSLFATLREERKPAKRAAPLHGSRRALSA